MNTGSKLAKAFVIFVVAVFIPYIAIAEEASEKPKTKLEAFQSQTGSVIIKGYTEIGEGIVSIEPSGSILQVRAMEFKSAETQKSMSGIVMEITGVSRNNITGSSRSFIDYDEIENLLKGLDYISEASADVTKHSSFEVKYSTRGNFSATTFNDSKGNIKAAIEVGHISTHLPMNKFSEFKSLISKAKSKIENR